MKKLILAMGLMMTVLTVSAQIPYFAGTAGDQNMYGYTSMKFKPGQNSQETYTTFQFGIGDRLAIGVDQYTGVGCNYFGYSLRANLMTNKWFNIGVQFTPSFDVNNRHQFSYLTSALYLNGAITNNLFWVSNTWYGVNKGSDNTLSNWWYLGYYVDLGKGHSITPMVGAIHSWKFDSDVNLAIGAYYSFKKFNYYLWCDQFINGTPRIVIGADFKMN
jgi:hypothetical protein